jgi:hypothetical protein
MNGTAGLVADHPAGPARGWPGVAVAALTESQVPAVVQPGAEALMAHVARTLRDQLRMQDVL